MNREAPKGAADRVPRAQAHTRRTIRVALVFVVAAGAAALAGERWLALHLFFAGGLASAISGVSLLLTVTWSAGPAPGDAVVRVQRTAVAAGALTIAVSVRAEWPDTVVLVGAAAHVSGLLLLAVLLVRVVRSGVQRRYDAAVVAYVLALGAGAIGVALGGLMAVGELTADARRPHLVLNLLGFVGLVITGTLPFFSATVGRSRMAARARTPVLLGVTLWSAGCVVAGAATSSPAPFAAYAVSVLVTLVMLPTPSTRQLQWAGSRLLALWAGAGWWATALVATAVDVARDRPPLAGRWLVVLVVAGFGQIFWGSLAYLLPVLRGGGHERLAEGFATTRSWPGLAAVNAAGVTAAAGLPATATGALVTVWILDGAWRGRRVGTRLVIRTPAASPAGPTPPARRGPTRGRRTGRRR